MTIGDRIRRIRKKRRLTQAELAMMSGLSLSAIQGYEQGRYEPKRKSLESIAEVFKIPVDELYDMPAQHGTNLAEVGTDCISRQSAIDALRKLREEDIEDYGCEIPEGFNQDHLDRATFAIKQLPPIQPDSCSEIPNNSDTISRQAAIDALKNDMASLDHIIKGMSAYDVRLDAYVSQRNQVNYDIYTINNLPPAQPEIIRCRECKFASGDSRICMKFDHSPIGELDFCSFAERRENE